MKNKTLNTVILALTSISTHYGYSMGIHSSDLSIDCKVTATTTQVAKETIFGAFTDRAGNYHPPEGYASFKVELSNESEGCSDLEQIGVSLSSTQFGYSKSYDVSELSALQKLSAQEIGTQETITLKQYHGYQNPEGYLEFYPLISSQRLVLSGKKIKLSPELTAKPAKEYLSEEEKIELTQAIFSKLKEGNYENNSYLNPLLYALTKHHPQFQKNFKSYLEELLAVFDVYENKPVPEIEYYYDDSLASLATEISKMTHSYPEYYEFEMPKLIADHPSLLNHPFDSPNMTAIDLEEALVILEEKLSGSQISAKAKKNFEKPLKLIAGYVLPGGALGNLSSQKAKDTAKNLLETHY